MSGSMTLKEKFEALMKNYQYLENKNEYLKKQLGESFNNKRRALHSDSANSSYQSHEEVDSQHNPLGTSSESDSEPRQIRSRRHHHKLFSFNIKIEIPKFEGRLDLDEFLD